MNSDDAAAGRCRRGQVTELTLREKQDALRRLGQRPLSVVEAVRCGYRDAEVIAEFGEDAIRKAGRAMAKVPATPHGEGQP
jgi:hypothetical protein